MANYPLPEIEQMFFGFLSKEYQEFIRKATFIQAPEKNWIRHCTNGYVILTDFDKMIRVMGDFIVGDSHTIKFFRVVDHVLVIDFASEQYTVLLAKTKTAGFGTASRDDKSTLAERLRNATLSMLYPRKDDAFSYEFVTGIR